MATTKRRTLGTGKTQTEARFNWESAETFEEAADFFLRWRDHVNERPASQDRRKRNLLYASLYANLPMIGFGANSYTRNNPHQGRIALNATQNAIDSLTSKLCKERPRPMFTTVEGPYELKEKAQNADMYIDGRFYQLKYYQRILPGKVLDACIYGLGATKAVKVDGEAVIERTFPWELIIDDRECMYGDPVHLGQRKWMDKQVCWDRYRRDGKDRESKDWNKELEEAISANSSTDEDDFDRDEGSEQIVVYEGWRNATARSPGKRIECIRGKTLVFETYAGKAPPFSWLRPEVQPMGFWGIGICERVATIQGEINRIIRDIQMAMHLMAKPHWMVESSSNVNTASLNNDIATIIKYTGSIKPEVYTPSSMSGEVFQHLQYLVRTLYEITGISQLSAQSQKPAGLSSAVALRTYLNVETERFSNFLRNTEESAAEDAMNLARVLGSLPKAPKMVARSGFKGRDRKEVKWDSMDFDRVDVQIYPTSKLPDTPAGRREYALELAQYTQVGTDDIYEMLEWDDTEAFAKKKLAWKRNLEKDFAALRRGEKVTRDPIGNHKAAYLESLDAYEEARNDGLPPVRLSNFREYIKQCYRLLTGKAWSIQGPNPVPGEADPNAPPPPVPGAPPMGAGPMMGAPAPMLPPGAPPPPMQPMPNGGATM